MRLAMDGARETFTSHTQKINSHSGTLVGDGVAKEMSPLTDHPIELDNETK